MRKIYKKAISLGVLLCLLAGILLVVFAQETPIYFDLNLPTAVSAGLNSYQLELLSDEEIRYLHQPYIDVTYAINLELDVIITPGTLDCYFVTREDILYVISQLSLAEHEYKVRTLGEQIRRAAYTAKIAEKLFDAGHAETWFNLLNAFDNQIIDPMDVYYLFQQTDGVYSFVQKIKEMLELS